MNITKPVRATRSYTQSLIAAPEAVFPLLCPVREADWIEGWDPVLVVSATGIAEVDCVFTTRAEPIDAIWYITRHEPATGFVEMLKVTPNVTACRLSIQLRLGVQDEPLSSSGKSSGSSSGPTPRSSGAAAVGRRRPLSSND